MPLMIAGGGHRDPRHLHGPDREPDRAEQHDVDHQHQPDALPGKARVEVALDPVVGGATAVLFQRLQVLRFIAVELGTLPEHLADAAGLRAVRVFLGLAFGVVLAMDRHPFLGNHAGREPEPEPEKMADGGMQLESPMRLLAVEIDGDAGDGDVRQDEGHDDDAPPRKGSQTVGDDIKQIKGHGMVLGSTRRGGWEIAKQANGPLYRRTLGSGPGELHGGRAPASVRGRRSRGGTGAGGADGARGTPAPAGAACIGRAAARRASK